MVDSTLARAYGTLAGFGFIGVALLALPSTRLIEPLPEPQDYFLTLAVILTGLVCLAIPWDRIDIRWLHLVGVAATVEAAASVAVFGSPYVAFYFVIVVLVAYVSPDLRSLGLQLALVLVALFGPVAYGPEDARTSLHLALVVAPVLLLTAGLFAYLRQKTVHDRRAYHRFAEQTLVLSSQIAGRELGPARSLAEAEPIVSMARVRLPRPLLAAAAAVAGIPLLAGGLAVAGVKLPDVATDPFEQVGIELPNQDEAGPAIRGEPEDAVGAARSRQATPRDASRPDGPAHGREGAAPSEDGGRPAATAAPEQQAAAPDPRDAPEPAPGTPDEPGATSAEPSPQAEPAEPSEPRPVRNLLEQATQGVEGLLGGLDAGQR
jgi:hypothetical protein